MLVLARGQQKDAVRVEHALSNMHAIAESIETAQDARDACANLKTLEDLLKRLDELDRQIAKYVALEIETYRRINELGLALHLKKASQRRIATWIGEQTDDEIDTLVRRCIVGPQTVERFFINIIRPKQIYDAAAEACDKQRKKALDDYKEGKSIYLDSYFFVPDGRASESVKSCYRAMKSQTRSDLLKLGAVGCGDGWYIDPKAEGGKERNQDFLTIRADSVIADLRNFMELADLTNSTCEQNERVRLVASIAKAFDKELSEVMLPKGGGMQ